MFISQLVYEKGTANFTAVLQNKCTVEPLYNNMTAFKKHAVLLQLGNYCKSAAPFPKRN